MNTRYGNVRARDNQARSISIYLGPERNRFKRKKKMNQPQGIDVSE